jgi:hypothetical protein
MSGLKRVIDVSMVPTGHIDPFYVWITSGVHGSYDRIMLLQKPMVSHFSQKYDYYQVLGAGISPIGSQDRNSYRLYRS